MARWNHGYAARARIGDRDWWGSRRWKGVAGRGHDEGGNLVCSPTNKSGSHSEQQIQVRQTGSQDVEWAENETVIRWRWPRRTVAYRDWDLIWIGSVLPCSSPPRRIKERQASRWFLPFPRPHPRLRETTVPTESRLVRTHCPRLDAGWNVPNTIDSLKRLERLLQKAGSRSTNISLPCLASTFNRANQTCKKVGYSHRQIVWAPQPETNSLSE